MNHAHSDGSGTTTYGHFLVGSHPTFQAMQQGAGASELLKIAGNSTPKELPGIMGRIRAATLVRSDRFCRPLVESMLSKMSTKSNHRPPITTSAEYRPRPTPLPASSSSDKTALLFRTLARLFPMHSPLFGTNTTLPPPPRAARDCEKCSWGQSPIVTFPGTQSGGRGRRGLAEAAW